MEPAKQASAKLRDLQGMPRNASILEGRQHICLPNPVRDQSIDCGVAGLTAT